MHHRSLRTSVTAAAMTLLIACSGSGEGLDTSDPPPPPPPSPPDNGDPSLVPEFSSIQQHVFSATCTQCHAGGAAPEGLRLEADVSYGMLVEVPSTQVPELMRVEPGDPDNSYLVQKLEGTAAVGDRMPQGMPPLDGDTIAVIRQWITEGAEPPAAAMAMTMSSAPRAPATLAAGWPVNDALVEGPAQTLVVVADAALDVTRINHASVRLLRPDQNEAATLEPREVAGIAIGVSSQAPTRITVQVPDGEWTAGHYELRVSGSDPSPVTDLAGVTIDGNADGAPGGDFVLRFDVEPGL